MFGPVFSTPSRLLPPPFYLYFCMKEGIPIRNSILETFLQFLSAVAEKIQIQSFSYILIWKSDYHIWNLIKTFNLFLSEVFKEILWNFHCGFNALRSFNFSINTRLNFLGSTWLCTSYKYSTSTSGLVHFLASVFKIFL